jgi:hypothetical protein
MQEEVIKAELDTEPRVIKRQATSQQIAWNLVQALVIIALVLTIVAIALSNEPPTGVDPEWAANGPKVPNAADFRPLPQPPPHGWGFDFDKLADRLLGGFRDGAIEVKQELKELKAEAKTLGSYIAWLAIGLVVLLFLACFSIALSSIAIFGMWRRTAAVVCLLLAVGGVHAQHGPPAQGPQIDYPKSEWMKNIVSRLDGSGMCVFTSIEMSAIWCGIDEFRGFRDWCAQNYPGGGYPQKVDNLIDAYCKAKQIPKPHYMQTETSDLGTMRKALESGRMVAVTLYHSKRYRDPTIFHMVCGVHADAERGAYMDNNVLQGDSVPPIEWNTIAGLEQQVKYEGRVWVFCWLRHGPPPVPVNR